MVKRLRTILQENRRYIGIAVLLMFMGGVIGYISADQFTEVLKRMIEGLKKSSEQMRTPTEIFWFIFKNNVMVSISMIGFGVFLFGIYPAFSLLINGAVLGFFLKTLSSKGLGIGKVLLGGILPHGILELSVIILAGAIGIRIGVQLYQWFLSVLVPERRKAANDRLYRFLEQLPLLFGVIVVGLLVAAIIEATITPFVLDALLTEQERMTMQNTFK